MTDKNVESGVVPEPTTEQITEVVKEMKVASLSQLKELPAIRVAKAVPFVIPGTELTVMLAPCDGVTQYSNSIKQMKLLSSEDVDEQEAMMRAIGNAIVKSCVVEPKLDDDALQALNEYNGTALTALMEKCKEISDLADMANTVATETFS